MLNTGKFAGKTLILSGGSRGIGKAIALKMAKDKANIVILAKTTTAHSKLEGTIYSVAEEIEAVSFQLKRTNLFLGWRQSTSMLC